MIKKTDRWETSASFVDQIVSNRDQTSKNIAEQKLRSARGGQDDLKVTGSEGIGLTGDQTGLTGLARNSGKVQNVSPRSKGMKKKPSFTELLHKYQKIADQNKHNRLRFDQSRNSSSPSAKGHQRWSSHGSSSFIPSMHMPWNTYSSIPNYNPWFWYNPWLPYYDY